MERLLDSDRFTIQSKIKWFPSFKTKFQILNEAGTQIGEIIFHPVLMAPVLWFFGLLLELGLVAGGFGMVIKGDGNLKMMGFVMLLIGAFLMLILKFRTFLSSRASSSVEIFGEGGELMMSARKGWALFRPTFTIKKADDSLLGESKQSFLWGDRHYDIWDAQAKDWGSIRRRILGFQYRVYKGKEQIARFRRKLVDARKLITGMRSYTLEFQTASLTLDERALVLGSLAYADVLTRQKQLREEKSDSSPAPSPKKDK